MSWKISASQVRTWLSCPWSYHLKYGLGLESRSTPALERGKEVHSKIFEALSSGKGLRSMGAASLLKELADPKSIEPVIELPLREEGAWEFWVILIPDLVYEDRIVDLKTVGRPEGLEEVHPGEILQMHFYSRYTGLPTFLAKVWYSPITMYRIHRVQKDPEVEEQIDSAIEGIMEYHVKALTPAPKVGGHCKECLMNHHCAFYKEVVGR